MPWNYRIECVCRYNLNHLSYLLINNTTKYYESRCVGSSRGQRSRTNPEGCSVELNAVDFRSNQM